MKRTILFDDDLTKDNVSALIKEIEEVGEEPTILYFSSDGGPGWCGDALCRSLSDRPNIEIVLSGVVYSCGFHIIADTNNPMSLGPYFMNGMVHMASVEISMREAAKKENNPSNMAMKEIKRMWKQDLRNKYREFLTKKEIKRYKKGEDIFLDRDRIEEILRIREDSIQYNA